MWAYSGKVFIEDNGNKEETKHLTHLNLSIISLILMIDTHLFLLNVFCYR